MKILLDTCVWGGTKAGLLAAGYDVIWSGDWDVDPGDETILKRYGDELLEGAIVTVTDKRIRIRAKA